MCSFRWRHVRPCGWPWASASGRAPRCWRSTARERGDPMTMRRFPRPSMRRVVIVVPSLFTLFNLFFGIWSMVLASRGEFDRAGWYIFFAGILDALDGRVARLSKTGTRFGAELDSLVDVVSFGVAPAFLIYQLEFASAGQAEWIFCYFYVMAAAIRLRSGEFDRAGWYIFFAGILDALDGRVARLSKTGTRFGAELDSLVDVVSFGVAPAFLIYQLEFASAGQAEWIFCYFYVMAAAIRL